MGAPGSRMAALALAVVLSGAPAAVVACAALCLPWPAMAHVITPTAAAPRAADAQPPSTGDAHHHCAPAPGVPAPGDTSVAAAVGAHACCPEPQLLTAVSVAAPRPGAPAAAVAVTTPAAWRHARPATAVSRALWPPSLPAAQARPPLVLRI